MCAIVVYRGPLERSRLSYLMESMARSYGAVKLVWLYPQGITRLKVEHFQSFVALNPWIEDWEIMDGSSSTAPSSLAKLRRHLKATNKPIIAVGFTTIFFVAPIAANGYIWCINGIPEEDTLHNDSLSRRLFSRIQWRLAQAMRSPSLIVTVSEPMSQLMARRWPKVPSIAAPNCVDVQTFSPKTCVNKQYMTYLGTGAPWQDLDLLSKIWEAMYDLDSTLQFRVISRDERTKILAKGVPAKAIEFIGVEQPCEVAPLLWQAEAGFLIRRPNQINQVSFPTKLGEYLAAGAYVVTSDLAWDPGKLVQETGCGITVSPRTTPEQIAKATIEFRQQVTTDELRIRCQAATALLDRDSWVETLSARLAQ